jgi:hypothetical protein
MSCTDVRISPLRKLVVFAFSVGRNCRWPFEMVRSHAGAIHRTFIRMTYKVGLLVGSLGNGSGEMMVCLLYIPSFDQFGSMMPRKRGLPWSVSPISSATKSELL